MISRLLALLLLVVATVSCDRVKTLATKAATSIKEKIAGQGGGSNGPDKVDAELQKLVDQNAEGAIFRKDLPFPTRLEVQTTRNHEISGRFSQGSAIELRRETVQGTQTIITKLERSNDKVRYTLQESSFTPYSPPSNNNQKAPTKPGAEPAKKMAPAVAPVSFSKVGQSWQAENRLDFRAAVLAKELSPVFEQLLTDNALAPRPFWFAKRRFKIGDELVVAGDSLPMLLLGNAKGSFKLKLDSFDNVAGHPCGVFLITGDFSRKQARDFEGNTTDEEITIQAGKMWLSLIYPIVLREELTTIQSTKSGGQGGLVVSGQGSVKVAVTRVWKRLNP